jgi:DNA-binding Lrp family transcriptional regulator
MKSQDQALINLLKADARMPVAELARRLGVSRSTVQSRIERLERAGVIAGYTLRLAQDVARRRITAHVWLAVNPKQAEKVVRALKAIPFVTAVYALSGGFDYLAIIQSETTQEIDTLLDQFGRMEGIDRTETSIVLSVKFER